MRDEIKSILLENVRRNAALRARFNPVTGEGSLGERVRVDIKNHPLGVQWIPEPMACIPWVKDMIAVGDWKKWMKKLIPNTPPDLPEGEENGAEVEDAEEMMTEKWMRTRCYHDFAYWAYLYVRIKPKGGGEDIPFRLNRPQRMLIETFEHQRLDGKPIRLILLKARQWGGSTATQMYMAWLQLVRKKGLNSNIVGHFNAASAEVRGMFDKMMSHYPVSMLHELGDTYDEKEAKMIGDSSTTLIRHIPLRNCKVKTGSAETPNSARGGDSALVHCTEVAFWKKTDGKTPEDIVRSACAGTTYIPDSMIVYESTANGTGNFFQREYDAAKRGVSQFESLFVAWWQIEWYSTVPEDIVAVATELWEHRDGRNPFDERSESGSYYWRLWEMGATLEAIEWYRIERRKYNDHGGMAAEYPSDDVEAFVHSGARVFDPYKVRKLARTCRAPLLRGEVVGDGASGKEALCNLRFVEDSQGALSVWEEPEIDEKEKILNRYLVVVDIGGRGTQSDWSVIMVLDRVYLLDDDKPCVVAQWYGHIDMDLLAWKSAQIAKWYDDALLVIESNTLETHDRERDVDGDGSSFILRVIKDEYDNLYERERSAEEIAEGAPVRYGFHTNVKTKPEIISTLVMVVREGLYVERDEGCLDEMLTYEKRQNGSYGAIPGKHDDKLMTRAIGLHVSYYQMERPRVVSKVRKKLVQKTESGWR